MKGPKTKEFMHFLVHFCSFSTEGGGEGCMYRKLGEVWAEGAKLGK